MRGAKFLGTFLALACCAAEGALAPSPPGTKFWLELDSHWYPMPLEAGDWYSNTFGYYTPTVNASGCHRSDGQPQTLGGAVLYVGPSFFPIYNIVAARYHSLDPPLPGKGVFIYQSASGKIICSGEVISPLDEIFGNGFERPDEIFGNGFEART